MGFDDIAIKTTSFIDNIQGLFTELNKDFIIPFLVSRLPFLNLGKVVSTSL